MLVDGIFKKGIFGSGYGNTDYLNGTTGRELLSSASRPQFYRLANYNESLAYGDVAHGTDNMEFSVSTGYGVLLYGDHVEKDNGREYNTFIFTAKAQWTNELQGHCFGIMFHNSNGNTWSVNFAEVLANTPEGRVHDIGDIGGMYYYRRGNQRSQTSWRRGNYGLTLTKPTGYGNGNNHIFRIIVNTYNVSTNSAYHVTWLIDNTLAGVKYWEKNTVTQYQFYPGAATIYVALENSTGRVRFYDVSLEVE